MSRAPADGFGTRARQLATIVCLISCGVAAGAADLQLEPGRSKCEEVRFGGDVASCGDNECVLTGAVYLLCDDLKLWADELKIYWTSDHEFSGAEARGHALLVDGNTVVHCEKITIEGDRIRGRIDDAIVEIKEHPIFDSRGIPTGKNASILRGDIERPAPGQLVVRDGSYTLCDCGADPPSWRIDAPEITVELNERATIWWPMLYVNPFGLGLVPVTPPLLPISVPLKERALGFLPPKVTFYGPWPTIDIPIFVPLGPSWDVTVAPGLRSDWVRTHKLNPERWGAPRLGGRVRYAPLEQVSGELQAQWTWDQRLGVARTHYREKGVADQMYEILTRPGSTLPPDIERWVMLTERERRTFDKGVTDQMHAFLTSSGEPLPVDFQRLLMLAELEHRVTLNWKQQVHFTDTLRWHTDVEWLSDDNIRQDFGVTLGEQVVNYIPSRTQLLWTPTATPVGLVASLAADHLLVIGNSKDTRVNYAGAELRVPHRGPAARISLLPTAIAPDTTPGLHIDADAAFARYGAWDISSPAALMLGGGEVGISYMDSIGPVSLRARASGHAIWAEGVYTGAETATEKLGTSATAFLHLAASAEVTWARTFDDWTHTVTPRLSYTGIPELRRSDPGVAEGLRNQADERLDIRKFHQVMVAVDQGLYVGGAKPRQLATLTVGLPFDLRDPRALGLLLEASWKRTPFGSGSTWAMIDPARADEKLQELGAVLSWPLGPVTVATTYVRFAQSAERFNRSIYALAGVGPDSDATTDVADWVHSIVASISYRSERVHISYTAATLLRRPGEALLPERVRPTVSQHRLSAGYRSACDCWEIGISGAIPGDGTAQEVLDRARLQVSFSIAGWALGNRL